MIDQERIISGAIMKRRTSDTFINCKKPENTIVNKKRTLLGVKQMNYFGTSIMNGSCVAKQFERNARTIETEVDWTIIQNVFNLDNAGDDDDAEMLNGSQAVEVLRNESQTRKSNRLSTRRSNQIQKPLPAQKDAVVRESNQTQKQLPEPDVEENDNSVPLSPLYVHNETSELNRTEKQLSPRKEKEIRKSNGFRDPEDEENIISAPASPLYVRENHDPFGDIPIDLPDADLITPPMDFRNNNCTDILNANTLVQNLNVPVDDSDSEDIDLGNVCQINDTITSLKEDSLELQVLKKLIGLWTRNVHPINVDNILPTKCNRIQAARTFGSLLGMQSK